MSWIKRARVGESSNGTVCLARSVDSPEKYAVVKSTKRSEYSSLKKEAKLLKFLRGNHQHLFIVRCYGVDTSTEAGEERYNVLIEHAPGGTLADLISCETSSNIPENLVAYYSRMLLQAISYIHRRGVIHNDIKPSNVLVFNSRNGWKHLKLADFGKAVQKGDAKLKAGDVLSFGQTVDQMINVAKSDLLQNFLSKCLEPDPEKRWTADMLLGHDFVKTKTPRECFAPGFEWRNLIQNPKPFDKSDDPDFWLSENDMFSGEVVSAELQLLPSPARPVNEPLYELFAGDGSSRSHFHLCFDGIREGLNRYGYMLGYRY